MGLEHFKEPLRDSDGDLFWSADHTWSTTVPGRCGSKQRGPLKPELQPRSGPPGGAVVTGKLPLLVTTKLCNQ